MAYIIPLEQPLSESQAKLIAQVGSMRNLTDLPFLKKFKIKKENEVSTFDYLLKVLRAMGIDPQLILTTLLNELFKTEVIVDIILSATARLATGAKIKLDSSATFTMPSIELTADEKKQLTNINYKWLNSNSLIKNPLTDVVGAMRTVMIQELMIIMFGKPKQNEASYGQNGLTNDKHRFDELINESVCGGDFIFSVSSPAKNNNGELEYNRIQKKEKVENGNLTFKITCEDVEISLPDNPMYLFRDVPPGFQSSQPISPQEALSNVISYVGNQIQKENTSSNNQSNAATGQKSFTQKVLETFITSATCLLSPFFVGIIGAVPGEAQGLGPQALQMLTDGFLNSVFPGSVTTNQTTGERVGDFVPATSCDVLNNYKKESLSLEQKKKLALTTILCNLILNLVIGFLLAYVLRQVKQQIKSFVAKRAQERQIRKINKMKNRFDVSTAGKIQKKSEKSARQVKLMQKISNALLFKENTSNIPNIT